jgi:hypothetical protein
MRAKLNKKIDELAAENEICLDTLSSNQLSELIQLTNQLGDLLSRIREAQHPKYSVVTHGLVSFIRIFINKTTHATMATLFFEKGKQATIEWAKRYEYAEGITDETVMYDERCSRHLSESEG